MTESDCTMLIERMSRRWKWFSGDAELATKVWELYGRFSFETVIAAVNSYDLEEPDLSPRTFRHKRLLGLCFDETQAGAVTFEWPPCHEAEFAAECWFRTLRHLPAMSIEEFAIDMLKLPRVPTDAERQTATEKLKAIGALPANEVYSRQHQNHDAFRRMEERRDNPSHDAKLRLQRRAGSGRDHETRHPPGE